MGNRWLSSGCIAEEEEAGGWMQRVNRTKWRSQTVSGIPVESCGPTMPLMVVARCITRSVWDAWCAGWLTLCSSSIVCSSPRRKWRSYVDEKGPQNERQRRIRGRGTGGRSHTTIKMYWTWWTIKKSNRTNGREKSERLYHEIPSHPNSQWTECT